MSRFSLSTQHVKDDKALKRTYVPDQVEVTKKSRIICKKTSQLDVKASDRESSELFLLFGLTSYDAGRRTSLPILLCLFRSLNDF